MLPVHWFLEHGSVQWYRNVREFQYQPHTFLVSAMCLMSAFPKISVWMTDLSREAVALPALVFNVIIFGSQNPSVWLSEKPMLAMKIADSYALFPCQQFFFLLYMHCEIVNESNPKWISSECWQLSQLHYCEHRYKALSTGGLTDSPKHAGFSR